MMRPWSITLTAMAVALTLDQGTSVRASIVERPGAAPGEAVIALRLQPAGLALGSYQGTMRFTPGSFVIVSAATPKGDGTRIVNVADSARGIVRFAGFTVSGFSSLDVLTLVVRPARKLDAANLAAELDVAGDLNGVPVPRDHLVPARGITQDPGKNQGNAHGA